MPRPRLVLASASPRRRSLLRLLDVPFSVRAPRVSEVKRADEDGRTYVLRLAQAKARAVARLHPRLWVLGADTAVCPSRRILGRPRGRRDADAMLRLLSGRVHRVWTAVALLGPRQRARQIAVCTRVAVEPLSGTDRRAYLDSGEWRGRAGGYSIQGRFAAFVRRLEGDFSSVAGLPLAPVRRLLHRAGLLRRARRRA